MHYNSALLPEKLTICIAWLLFMESNSLLFFSHLGWACIFLATVTGLSQKLKE